MWSCPCCLRFKFSPEEIEQRYKSLEIDKMLEKDKQALKRQVKLLLLGAGESGKSTFLKQMKIIHGIKFESELVMEYQQIIYQNVIKGMRVLVDARDKLGIPWGDPSNATLGKEMLQFNAPVLDSRTFIQFCPLLVKLWRDNGILRAFDRRREFQLVSMGRESDRATVNHNPASSELRNPLTGRIKIR
jgi:guanine nucleotide-binding protein subunit alpha-12